jgi:hypothetical protein
MANLNSITGIYPDGSGYLQQYNIFSVANLSSGGGSYIHMKTNVTHPSSNLMIMLEAVGYNYGTAAPIRCAWNFYSYAYQISNVQTSAYNGMSAHSIYISSDNYYVIVGYASSLYYCGFTINTYNTAGNGYGHPTTITASVQSSSSTYY